jgi:hypothetical protein
MTRSECSSCRCGGQFKINEEQMGRDVTVVQCNGCTLSVRVQYEEAFDA